MLKMVVLCSVVAAATSNLISPIGGVSSIAGISPFAGISPLAGISPFAGVAPLAGISLIAPVGPLALSAPLLAHNNNYRGPLSLAPGQPANIIAADGRPLDTLAVNLDRSAHITAKALEGVRPLYLRKKRSASLIAPLSPLSPLTIGNPLIARAAALGSIAPLASIGPIAPIAPISPLGLSAPLLAANNYRGPLSLAPGQPANIIAADGRPLDTLAVNLDRSAHLTARALEGVRTYGTPLINPAIFG